MSKQQAAPEDDGREAIDIVLILGRDGNLKPVSREATSTANSSIIEIRPKAFPKPRKRGPADTPLPPPDWRPRLLYPDRPCNPPEQAKPSEEAKPPEGDTPPEEAKPAD